MRSGLARAKAGKSRYAQPALRSAISERNASVTVMWNFSGRPARAAIDASALQ
jgi:hypothetical protein